MNTARLKSIGLIILDLVVFLSLLWFTTSYHGPYHKLVWGAFLFYWLFGRNIFKLNANIPLFDYLTDFKARGDEREVEAKQQAGLQAFYAMLVVCGGVSFAYPWFLANQNYAYFSGGTLLVGTVGLVVNFIILKRQGVRRDSEILAK